MPSRTRAFWQGFRRGIRFGAFAGVVIWLVVSVICLGLVLSIPTLRHHALADLDTSGWGILSAIGGVAATCGLMAFYGAAAGALVMSIGAISRVTKPESPETN
jgi:hypothetical protein